MLSQPSSGVRAIYCFGAMEGAVSAPRAVLFYFYSSLVLAAVDACVAMEIVSRVIDVVLLSIHHGVEHLSTCERESLT